MQTTRPLKVFLCHASADKPAVRKLYQRLSAEGWIDPWFDEERLSLGQHWTIAIEEALDEADVVLIFLSSNSVKKEGFVQREMNYAWDISLEKPRDVIFLIPFRLDDCQVPRYLGSRQWGDYFGEKEESTYQNLLRSLMRRHQQKIKLEMEEQEQHDIVEKVDRKNIVQEVKETLLREPEEYESLAKAAREQIEQEAKEKSARGKSSRIFIGYKCNVEPDTPVATAVFEALRHDHDVFMDTTLQVGEIWAERIQNAIKESDYMIIFLSENSVNSEMVIAEIETAYHYAKTHGKPVILPVRLAYIKALVYPISAFLNPLQWALWGSDADTPRLIAELRQSVLGGRPLNDVGSPGGTMSYKSPFYIERDSDREAIQVLENYGFTIIIKGSRQTGKSSLLNRFMTEAVRRNMSVAFIDFQMIDDSTIERPDIFYRQFCSLLSREFKVKDQTEEFWKSLFGQVHNTTNYVTKYLLNVLQNTQLLVVMDEVERMFASPFRSDFFSMLRSWHNNRARGGDWLRFNMALSTSTEPYQLIADLNQSPFNVGTVVELKDFTPAQVSDLNQRYGNPLSARQADEISVLLGGHPYLTRKALYLVASKQLTFDEIVKSACEDDGPFGDNLRNHLFRMSGHPELISGLVQVIKYLRCEDEHIFFRLRGAGLVRRVGNEVLPRNQLYAEYFGRRLSE